MATKAVPTTDNLTVALDALEAELGRDVPRDELEAYAARINEVVAKCREVRRQHDKALKVIASRKSKSAQKERVARALALLEEREAAETR